MKRAVLTFVGVLTAASACSVPARALDTLMRPVPGEVVLAFGSRYGSGSGRTHSGLDLAAGAGEPVLAPCDGRVVFAGLVPADGGGRVGAVTIEPEAGVLVTVLPLESVEVRRGDAVAEGAAVGSIAAAGDDSSEAPHLHLSVRRDGRYVDPGPVLETVQPSSAVGGEPDRAADAGGAMPAADASACEQTGAWQACAHPST
ncbi:MAG: M23 family metallopeptidase, partial [Coriobacteriia bacterium]|nr:M23 family metallopeptidase [Coriobacteriia bacterium]